ncbi:MAG: hypothetical protein LBI29_01540 [Rickettsiales bacterium]|jgi:hypothetical protein|nr:hypothetical protein [Rickettsiales bacterium]
MGRTIFSPLPTLLDLLQIQFTLNIHISGTKKQSGRGIITESVFEKDLGGKNRSVIALWTGTRTRAKASLETGHEFSISTNYRERNREYVVEIGLPNSFMANDIGASLCNPVLN